MTIHMNNVARYLRGHPQWANDQIPLCDGPGDTPEDHYTIDAAAVTCEACRFEMNAPLIDAGKLCPDCKGSGHIYRETVNGLPLFWCRCGCRWFDHLTMEAEDA